MFSKKRQKSWRGLPPLKPLFGHLPVNLPRHSSCLAVTCRVRSPCKARVCASACASQRPMWPASRGPVAASTKGRGSQRYSVAPLASNPKKKGPFSARITEPLEKQSWWRSPLSGKSLWMSRVGYSPGFFQPLCLGPPLYLRMLFLEKPFNGFMGVGNSCDQWRCASIGFHFPCQSPFVASLCSNSPAVPWVRRSKLRRSRRSSVSSPFPTVTTKQLVSFAQVVDVDGRAPFHACRATAATGSVQSTQSSFSRTFSGSQPCLCASFLWVTQSSLTGKEGWAKRFQTMRCAPAAGRANWNPWFFALGFLLTLLGQCCLLHGLYIG